MLMPTRTRSVLCRPELQTDSTSKLPAKAASLPSKLSVPDPSQHKKRSGVASGAAAAPAARQQHISPQARGTKPGSASGGARASTGTQQVLASSSCEPASQQDLMFSAIWADEGMQMQEVINGYAAESGVGLLSSLMASLGGDS